jgi:hypothetical protein
MGGAGGRVVEHSAAQAVTPANNRDRPHPEGCMYV